MSKFMKGMFLLICLNGWGQTDTLVFSNPRKMMEYAFSKTDFSSSSNPYFRNATLELEDSVFNKLIYKEQPIDCSGKGVLSLFSLMNWWDMSRNFHRDSVLFPVYDHFYSLDESDQLRIPFYVVDLEINSLKPAIAEAFRTSPGNDPYRKILADDLVEDEVLYASIFLDSFAYNNVILELNENTFFTNTNRSIDFVEITRKNETRLLYFNSSIDLSDWLTGKQKLSFTIHFSDEKQVQVNQLVEMNPREAAKSDVHQNFGAVLTITPDVFTSPSIYSPVLKYSVYHACSDQKIRKPFIMVAGWGPHTDMGAINNDQHWPASIAQLANQFNQEGLIENLHDEGFDVILCQFFPPNAYVEKNTEMLEKLINRVNNIKIQNNSYQENIIMGFSAGSLATRLALQKMEYKHLNENGPHPHTRLYISNDGEHGGANVPLGMQHAVEYLWEYEYNAIWFPNPMLSSDGINWFNPNILDYKTYALHYILNAPLSKQLLHYFHTSTGSGNNPGQGPSDYRTSYLAKHTTYNHSKNGARLGFPSFQRMISISNGSSTPDYNFSDYSSSQLPYPSQTGAIFFKQNGSLMGWVNRRFEATFLTHGIHRVFYYEFKQLFKGWKVAYEAKTKDPLILDNAPGGIIFIEKNPIRDIINELESELTGAPDIKEDYLFSFTPTVLTHDVKDLNSSLNNGYLDYNFKEHKLLYQNEGAANTGNPNNASNYFGYPHLGYPGNHYDYTVFDALFCWDENTEHLTGNRKDPNAYAGMDSPVKGVIKNFVVYEAEPDHIFLQNIRIGFYARPNYPYRVDYEAGNTIHLGNHVTQKTDFLDAVVESNAIVDAQAVNEIHFTPGVYIKNGSAFHAYIGEIICEKSMGNSNPGFPSGNEAEEEYEVMNERIDLAEQVSIFPNPSKQHFSIQWGENKERGMVEVCISDLSGKELFKKGVSLEESVVHHELKPGFYMVKLTKNGVCVTRNIVVE